MTWFHVQLDDNVLSEARNLRNMTIAQTPLLGEENTPLHTGPAGGTGFEGATPRHQVAFTPNPLATPLRAGGLEVSATPRDGQSVIGSTPLRTPMRDNLNINPEDSFSVVGDTPREQRMRVSSAKNSLRASFSSLPKPENNFELLVPEDEEEEAQEGAVLSEEDAAERDARIRRRREEEERKALARRTLAVQRGLPRPPNVDVDQLLQQLSIEDDIPKDDATELIHKELANLLRHDSIAHPVPGTALPGSTKSTYEIPDDDDVSTAKAEIQRELATAVGFPDANVEQVKEGLVTYAQQEELDESVSWANIRPSLAYDANSRRWVYPQALSSEARIEGLSAQLNDARQAMAKEAQKAGKTEKKLGVTLGGYQARSRTLIKQIVDGFEDLQRTQIEYESFSHLRANEVATGPVRVAALKEEVEKLERREQMLQSRYAELDSERQDAEARVAALEDKLMAEAEALNEAALAEIEAEAA